ncbi:MAG: M67 family metallopeptidase [Solirubrobacteraceae bacterium]
MDISQELLEQILAHAREEAPNECCGVVATTPVSDGEPAQAVRVHSAVNTAASPLRFEISGLEVMGLLDSIEGDGLEIGAIYHSHTRTAPYPSQTDINFAVNWPGVEWIIVGLADPSAPEIRSYLIEKGAVREVEIGQIAV